MRRILLLAWLGLAVCAGGRAQAQVLPQHAQTNVIATAEDLSNNDTHRGVLASASRAAISSPSGVGGQAESDGSANASGAAGLYTSWRLSTDAHAQRFLYGDSRVDSNATWSDTLFLGSTNRALVGDTLRLTVLAQGNLTYNGELLGNPTTSLVLSANNGDGTPGYSAGAGTSLGASVLDPTGFRSFGWNMISSNNTPNGTAFNGLLELDVPIPRGPNTGAAGPGSISFSIVDRSLLSIAGTDGNPHSGGIFASDPISLQSITLPDVGNVTPESLGVSLTFDSGLLSPNIASVPEPSSLILTSTAAIALLAFACARRHLKASAA
jgi:hypothetical protein